MITPGFLYLGCLSPRGVLPKVPGYANYSIGVCKLRFWGTRIRKITSRGYAKSSKGRGNTEIKMVENPWITGIVKVWYSDVSGI